MEWSGGGGGSLPFHKRFAKILCASEIYIMKKFRR